MTGRVDGLTRAVSAESYVVGCSWWLKRDMIGCDRIGGIEKEVMVVLDR